MPIHDVSHPIARWGVFCCTMKKIIISLLLSASVFAQQRLGYPGEELEIYWSYNPTYLNRFSISITSSINSQPTYNGTFAGETMKKRIRLGSIQQLREDLGAPKSQNRFWAEMEDEWAIELFYDEGLRITYGEQSGSVYSFDLYRSNMPNTPISTGMGKFIFHIDIRPIAPYYFSIGEKYRLGIGHPMPKQVLLDYKGEKIGNENFDINSIHIPPCGYGVYQDYQNIMLGEGDYIFLKESIDKQLTDAILVITVDKCKRIEKIHFANP